jgi:hypothetical protein
MLVYVELLIFANLIWDYISYILLFLHISKVSPHHTLYRLKGKKGSIASPYRIKNYAHVYSQERILPFSLRIVQRIN